MSNPSTPTTVEVGQMWRDNDQRTKGAGEFTVEDVGVTRGGMYTRATIVAIVRRHRTGRRTKINVDRLLKGTNTQRGYTYLGMSR